MRSIKLVGIAQRDAAEAEEQQRGGEGRGAKKEISRGRHMEQTVAKQEPRRGSSWPWVRTCKIEGARCFLTAAAVVDGGAVVGLRRGRAVVDVVAWGRAAELAGAGASRAGGFQAVVGAVGEGNSFRRHEACGHWGEESQEESKRDAHVDEL